MNSQQGKNLKNSFKDILMSRIFSGQLQPGDKLPPERELAEQLGFSRGSVNQGILDLERVGLIKVVPRKGAYVADYMRTATAETLSAIMSYDSTVFAPKLFQDLMELRILVERDSARLACKRVSASTRAILSEQINAIYCASEDEIGDRLYSFHKSITQLSGNAAYTIVFQSFEKMLSNLIKAHYSNRDELRRCLPLYDKLAAAISRGDATEADAVLLSILGRASDYISTMLEIKAGKCL